MVSDLSLTNGVSQPPFVNISQVSCSRSLLSSVFPRMLWHHRRNKFTFASSKWNQTWFIGARCSKGIHVLYILLRNHHMLFYVDFNASLIDVSVIISSVSACRDWMSLNICWIGYACLNNMCVKAEFNACLSLYCVRIEWTRWPWRRPVLILSETRPSLTPLLLLTPSVSLITLSCRSVCVDVLRLSCVSEASPAVWCCLGRRSLGFWNTAVVCLCLLDVFNL